MAPAVFPFFLYSFTMTDSFFIIIFVLIKNIKIITMNIFLFIVGVIHCLEFIARFFYTRQSYGNSVPWITYLFSNFFFCPVKSMLLGFFIRIAAIVGTVICLMISIPKIF